MTDRVVEVCERLAALWSKSGDEVSSGSTSVPAPMTALIAHLEAQRLTNGAQIRAIERLLRIAVSTRRVLAGRLLLVLLQTQTHTPLLEPYRLQLLRLVEEAAKHAVDSEVSLLQQALVLLTLEFVQVDGLVMEAVPLLCDWIPLFYDRSVLGTCLVNALHYFHQVGVSDEQEYVDLYWRFRKSILESALVSSDDEIGIVWLRVLKALQEQPPLQVLQNERASQEQLALTIRVLCRAVNVSSRESWQIIRNFLSGSFGQRSFHALLDLLPHGQKSGSMAQERSRDFDRVVRGAVFFIGMSSWGSQRISALEIPFVSVLGELNRAVQEVSNENMGVRPLIIFEVVLSLKRLIKKFGPLLRVEWDPIVDILSSCITCIDRRGLTESGAIAEESWEQLSTVLSEILISIIELHSNQELFCPDRLFTLALRFAPLSKSQIAMRRLLAFMYQNLIHPALPDWLEVLQDTMQVFLQTRNGVHVADDLSIEALDAFQDLASRYGAVFGKELVAHGLAPFWRLILDERSQLVQFQLLRLCAQLIAIDSGQWSVSDSIVSHALLPPFRHVLREEASYSSSFFLDVIPLFESMLSATISRPSFEHCFQVLELMLDALASWSEPQVRCCLASYLVQFRATAQGRMSFKETVSPYIFSFKIDAQAKGSDTYSGLFPIERLVDELLAVLETSKPSSKYAISLLEVVLKGLRDMLRNYFVIYPLLKKTLEHRLSEVILPTLVQRIREDNERHASNRSLLVSICELILALPFPTQQSSSSNRTNRLNCFEQLFCELLTSPRNGVDDDLELFELLCSILAITQYEEDGDNTIREAFRSFFKMCSDRSLQEFIRCRLHVISRLLSRWASSKASLELLELVFDVIRFTCSPYELHDPLVLPQSFSSRLLFRTLSKLIDKLHDPAAPSKAMSLILTNIISTAHSHSSTHPQYAILLDFIVSIVCSNHSLSFAGAMPEHPGETSNDCGELPGVTFATGPASLLTVIPMEARAKLVYRTATAMRVSWTSTTCAYHQLSSLRTEEGSTPVAISHLSAGAVLSQLGFASRIAANDASFGKLIPSEQLDRALDVLDRVPQRDTIKIGLVYVSPEQDANDPYQVLRNATGSIRYLQFVEALGQTRRLLNATDFTAGLDKQMDEDGKYAIVWNDSVTDVCFHVATLMPNDPKWSQAENKQRFIGNDAILIVFDESQLFQYSKKIHETPLTNPDASFPGLRITVRPLGAQGHCYQLMLQWKFHRSKDKNNILPSSSTCILRGVEDVVRFIHEQSTLAMLVMSSGSYAGNAHRRLLEIQRIIARNGETLHIDESGNEEAGAASKLMHLF